jgi:hypothetical protein
MPALKMSVARISAGLAVSAFFASTSFAATLVVNRESPLDIAGDPGFTYLVNGDSGSLNVATAGFLFCANIVTQGQQIQTPVTVIPQHGSWRLPIAQDVLGVSYNASQLSVNKAQQSTLVCHSAGAQGEMASGLTDGIFRNAYESKTREQFPNLINWIPSQGFDWNNPSWSVVPTDPCSPSVDQPAAVDENVTCAAVSGQRSAGAGATMRAPTLWTGTDGSNFFYVARVDARYGAQTGVPGVASMPVLGEAPQGTGSAQLTIIDAYDSGVVGVGGGYLSDDGTWCILNQFPTALSLSMCNGAPSSGALNGTLGGNFPGFSVGVPPLGQQQVSFYIAFMRRIIGAPPAVNEPAVAVSIMVEPSVVAEGGDEFKGDDVMFGFLPASTGFPWMTGQ